MGRETSKMPSLLFMLTVQDILNTHLVSLFKYATSILRSCILRSYTQNSQKLYLNTPFFSPNCILKVQISRCIYHQRKKKFKQKCNISKSLPRDKTTALSFVTKLLLSFHCWIFNVSLRLLLCPLKFLPNFQLFHFKSTKIFIIFLLVGCYLDMT